MEQQPQGSLLLHRKTRPVVSRSGQMFDVPVGISRNHGAGCWVVTFGRRDWTPVSFRAGGESRSLEKAKTELVRRIRVSRQRLRVAHVDRTERSLKTKRFGRPGVRFQVRTHRSGYFTSTVIHHALKKTLRFRVDFDSPEFLHQFESQWKLAIVARDVMLEWIAAGQPQKLKSLRSKHVPKEWYLRADMLDLSQFSVPELADIFLREREEL